MSLLSSTPNTLLERAPHTWFRSIIAPIADRVLALFGLIAAGPLLAIVAVWIIVEDGLPVFFLQERVGLGGRLFRIRKLRSMRASRYGPQITIAGDARILRVGRVIRKYKIDEIPQLWNVLIGEMSLVGPRPEVPQFVNMCDPVWRIVLSVRPGITDVATIVYRNEEELLAGAEDPESVYRYRILPEKLALNAAHVTRHSVGSYFKILFWSARYSFFPAGFDSDQVRRSFDLI
jgi:lipopolysaccharide/colanic/teichoic acid biosynthesis glycosyltransferase